MKSHLSIVASIWTTNDYILCRYICDGEKHQEMYTETFALQRFGALWIDYLYFAATDKSDRPGIKDLFLLYTKIQVLSN